MTHSANFFLVQIRHSSFFDLLASLPYAVQYMYMTPVKSSQGQVDPSYMYLLTQLRSGQLLQRMPMSTNPVPLGSTTAENACVY